MKDREVYKMAMEDLKFDELDMSINQRIEASKEKAEKPQKPVVISLDDSKSEKLIRIIPEDETGEIISNANNNQSSVLNNIKEIRENSLNKNNTSKKKI